MKKTMKMLAVAMLVGAFTSTAVFAADKKEKAKKEKKEWKWEMPAKLTGMPDFDDYLLTCDTLNARITSYMDSVVFYSVRVINVKQADGTTRTVRMVVDENGTIRNSNKAMQQYFAMINSGLGIVNDLLSITAKTTSATAALAGNPLMAISYGKYLKAGPKIAIEGGKTMKELIKRMNQQRKEIRQFKNDYTEDGELKDPTSDASKIDTNYSNNEPIEKTDEMFANELAQAKKEGEGIVPNDGDIDLGDI